MITNDPKERVACQSYRFVLATAGGMLSTVVMVPLANWIGDGDKAAGYQSSIAIFAVLACLMLLICFRSTKERIDAIVQRTRDGGAEIVGLLKTGSAFYAPATSAIEMAEAFLKDQKRLLPCAAYCNGVLGLKDTYVGVPTIIGAGGIEKVVDIKLSREEQEMFTNSVNAVRGLVEACKAIEPSLA